MSTKETLHRLIDHLPQRELEVVQRFVEDLAAERLHPAVRAILTAPIDDEPLTPEEEAAFEEGLAALEAGDVIRDDQLRL